ncbi:MAG TPA: subclass B3 metallo-beta-lactamase, partial [Novosphingobium sp.]|nr:subclass B3 metallo-beta-lactamase [Novosphingobium sp.]
MTRTRNTITLALAMAVATVASPFPAQAKPATKPAADTTPAHLAAACAGRDGWLDPAPPARIFANTWYVGTCGISAILVTGDEGHVLVDAGAIGAAPAVLANIRRAGFDPKDIRWIVASHEHHDHVGALAALQRTTGAKIAATSVQKAVLQTGKPTPQDPQFAGLDPIEPVRVDRTLADGDSVVVGKLAVTAHVTPVHAPGSTSWTWQSCTAGFDCKMIAYVDSSSTISSGNYRFSDHADRIAAVRTGLAAMAALPCDVLLTPHPAASAMMERFAGKQPLVDPGACRAYVGTAETRFAARLAEENAKEKTK